LATDSQASNIRFFGKVQGTQADYYIAEGSLEGGEEEEGGAEKPAEFEPRGSGVNKYVYWVTNNVLNIWTKLPDLNPSDIKAARKIKVLFSGNLDRKIHTNPFFFGLEKHYLRAQIARISFSTTIMPKGLFKLTEDNDREIEDIVPDEGELQMPSTAEMSRIENWVHNTPNILEAARVAHLDPEVPEGAPDDLDPEVLKKELEAMDPYQPRLKPIAKDHFLEVAEGA
jgi:radial spoke head protein 4A